MSDVNGGNAQGLPSSPKMPPLSIVAKVVSGVSWVILFIAVLWALYYPVALFVTDTNGGGGWTTAMFVATIAVVLGVFVAAAFVLIILTFMVNDSQFGEKRGLRFKSRQDGGFFGNMKHNVRVLLLWIIIPLFPLLLASASLVVSLIISNSMVPFSPALFFTVPLIVFVVVAIFLVGYKLLLIQRNK